MISAVSVDVLKEEYQSLFDHIIESGVDEQQALEMIKALPEQTERYMRVMAGIDIAIIFTEEDVYKKYPNWDNMTSEHKDKVLWENGMDTKRYNFHKRLAWMTVPREDGYKKELINVIYGQERLDKEWIEAQYTVHNGTSVMNYASDEARDFVWNMKRGCKNTYM